jgi:L-lactate dehydrogenase complex protein LldF
MSRDAVESLLKKQEEIETRWRSLLSMSERAEEAMRGLPESYLRDLLETREGSIKRLPELLKKLRSSIERAGGKLYVAETASEARRIIAKIVSERNVRIVVKAKTMTGEEIGINQALEDMGLTVIETDLGERVVQLAGQRPTHIIAPAVHLSRKDIASLIRSRIGVEVGEDPREITRFFRSSLWRYFSSADMGITGANIVVAETGHVVLVTNEGNGRLTASMPRVIVAVAGVEKLVESWEDAARILRVLPVSAVGRRATSYVTVLGPRGLSRWRGSQEFHLVLIDNGRTSAVGNEWLRDALRCIRCAACLDVCPTYRVLGGAVFGDIYTGPMGVPWTAITQSVEKASEIAKYCVSCSLCLDACPVKIDIPLAISWVKNAGRSYTLRDRMLTRYESYAKLGSRMPRLFNWLQGQRVPRGLMERVLGIDRRRLMHRFRGGSLYEALGPSYTGLRDPDIVYFPDTYAAYIDWNIGLLAVKLLENLGYTVAVAKTAGSGMPAIQYGLHHIAAKTAEKNVEVLAEYARRGARIICSEPTAAYCLAEAYPKLLKTAEARLVAESTRELLSFIVTAPGISAGQKPAGEAQNIFYHYPCHSRLIAPDAPSASLLSRLGYRVTTRDYGCCGIAGTWGMRRGVEGYSISAEIGRRVAREVLATGCLEIATESSVCAQQLRQFTGLKVFHTIRYVAEAFGVADKQEGVLNF